MSETTRPAPETRQKIIDALCESFARDEMEIGELEKRLELVHQAETADQLGLILADLPIPPVAVKLEGAANSPSSDLAPRSTLRDDRILDHSVIVGIMGRGARSGTWIPAENNWAVGVMGRCELDFREAQLGAGVTEVRVLAFMGGVKIIAPPGRSGGVLRSRHNRPLRHQQPLPSTRLPGRTRPAGHRPGVHGRGQCHGAALRRD